MEDKLRENKIKITPQRRDLIKTLQKLEYTHPSFNQIYESIKLRHPTISRSTVYENLKLLVNMEIIKSFNYQGETRYEMNTDPHINLAKPNGKIIDVNNRQINNYLQEIKKIMKEEEGINIKNLIIIAE